MILFVVVLFAITLTFPLQCNAVSIPRYPDESVAAKMLKIPIDKKFANYANARRDKKFSHFSFSISIIFRRFTKLRRTNRLQFCLYRIFSVLINGTIWNGKSTFFSHILNNNQMSLPNNEGISIPAVLDFAILFIFQQFLSTNRIQYFPVRY